MKIIFLILTLILGGCASKENTFTVIDAKTAYEMIQENKDIVILDVRTSEEYNTLHIPDAINLELATLESTIETVVPDKNQTVLIYCRSGNRSNQAARLLVKLGYTNIYDFGGINSWPYETE